MAYLLELDVTRLARNIDSQSVKIKLGFTAEGANPPFFVLDDPVKGVLDNTDYALGGGEYYYDVSEFFVSYEISRGKSRALDKFNAGSARVTFDNSNRYFDPLFPDSPYFGQIKPRRIIQILVDEVVQFQGVVDDWSIDYSGNRASMATCIAYDPLSVLSERGLFEFEPVEQLTGERITAALNNAGWSALDRNIDAGNVIVEETFTADGASVIDYCNTVAKSEPGEFFATKEGKIRFKDRIALTPTSGVVFTDSPTDDMDIRYSAIAVEYGTELLYNEIVVSNSEVEYVARDADSVEDYGARTLDYVTYVRDEEDLVTLADYLLPSYKDPEYRFSMLTINVLGLDEFQRQTMIDLELTDIVKVEFTPSQIPPQIMRYGRVIGIKHKVASSMFTIELQLETLESAIFVLDDPEFGVLDTNILGW